jgi:hypothetical protein
MGKKKARRQSRPRRCLIVERHPWETGGRQQQLQFPLDVANEFFGPGDAMRRITIRIFSSPVLGDTVHEHQISISREYRPSRTRRTNGFPEMGGIPAGFVFFEETDRPDAYEVWWQSTDVAVVAARYDSWLQARDSQHGRGRLAAVVNAPVPRPITRIDTQ